MLTKVLKFVVTALGLEVFTAGCGILGGFIGVRVWGDGSLIDLGLAIFGFIFGGFIGIAAGIIAIKYLFHQRGSVILALIFTVVWAGLTTLLSINLDLGNPWISNLVTIAFLAIPFAAVAGFYLKRDKQRT